MNIVDIINKKRLKGELNREEIDYVITNMLNENIKDYQISSLLMAIVLNGMTIEETVNLTDSMIKSGDVIELSSIDGIKVDKHSTGGVGDKVTLVLAPILASLGFKVAKMSGRGLGHTGGTIDKLEAINGYNVNLSKEQFIKQVNENGISVISQTGDIAIADKKLYALRDVTGTVESIPLIAASIMSKKIASGADFIILDVKVGKGALMKNINDAKELANTMIEIGKRYNKEVVCLLTNMDEPLGYAIGNSIEVIESIDTLKGNGPSDLCEIIYNMAALVLKKTKNIEYNDALNQIKEVIDKQIGYQKFEELIKLQNGDINSIKISNKKLDIKSNLSGYIHNINALKLGELARNLGAGRLTKEDKIDYEVGIYLNKKVSDYVNKGDILLTIYYNKELDIPTINRIISETYIIKNEQIEKPKLILDIVE